MLSLRKSLIAFAGTTALFLGGCGYHPVYGTYSATENVAISDHLNAIDIATIEDKEGIILRNALIDRMNSKGTPQNPLYRMKIDLSSSTSKLGIQSSDTATRANLTINAEVKLTELSTGKILYSDRLSSFVSYNILDSTYATFASENNAYKRGLTELADKITLATGLRLQQENL